MELYYKNNSGQIIDFTKPPFRMHRSTDLFNYSHSYVSNAFSTNHIRRFGRNITAKNIRVTIQGGTREDWIKARELILSVTEKDVYDLTPGRLYVNDSYLNCYFVENKKEPIRETARTLTCTYTLVSETGVWNRDNKTLFRLDLEEAEGNQNLDHPFDYSFDYGSGAVDRTLHNDEIAPMDFEMIIYGACQNPSVNIGGNVYQVNTVVETGEYLVINSRDKKVVKHKANGETVNQFYLRYRDSWIYEKIPAGINAVTWSGLFGFDVTLFLERSEPRWS